MPVQPFMRRPRRAIPAKQQVAKSDKPQTPHVSQDVVATTEIFTYFTKVGGTHRLVSATKWTRARLFLETAGPVAVSTKGDLVPVLSGKGILLPPGQEIEFVLPRGDRLYIAADAVNRVKVIIEPIAFGEQILQAILSLVGRR